MTLTTPPAAFPESALRAVLAGCVGAWARSASRLPEEGGGDTPRLLYVDAFAGAELQFGTGVSRAADEETRAAAAVRALGEADGGATLHAVFVEEDPAHLQRIYGDLERVAGGERLRATRDFATLDPGEATLVEADFRGPAAEIARFAIGARALLLVAPPAARRLPWEVLRPFVTAPNADVLIRFPHADFEKQSRHTGTLADLPGFARTIVEGASAMLDDAKHAWLPAWRAAAKGGLPAAMDDVLGRFRRLLESAAPGRIVQPAAPQSGGATTYLFLVTSDPELAAAFDAATSAVSSRPSAAPRAKAAPREAPPVKQPRAKGGRSSKAAKPIAEPETPAEVSPSPDPAPVAADADPPLPEAPPPAAVAEPPASPPERVVAAEPSAPAPELAVDAEPPAETPESAASVDSPASPPELVANADPPASTPEPVVDAEQPASMPDPVVDVEPSASTPKSPADVESSAPTPTPAAEVEPSASTSEPAADVDLPAPTPELVTDAELPESAPKPAADVKPPASKRKPAAPAPAPRAALTLDLFSDFLPPEPAAPAGADIDALAESLAARHAGQTVSWGDLLRGLAGATPDEAKRVLAALKRRGRATYQSLKNDADAVDFPRDPIAPAPAVPRKRKRAAEDAGFFGEEE